LRWKDQFERRFILSMDGNGATCSRVVIALMSNSVLLKYHSDNVLYYFDGMQPWIHYVPVMEDRDVQATIDLEAREPTSFARIAAAGQKFASTYLSRSAIVEYTRALLLLYADSLSIDQGAVNGVSESLPRTETTVGPALDGMAHISNLGDVRIDEDGWLGRRGSGNAIEGFTLNLSGGAQYTGLSYQTLDARGDLSGPMVAGTFSGTCGKGEPLSGFRLQPEPALAQAYDVMYEAQFIDGSRFGPVIAPAICSASSRMPLEAFRVTFRQAVKELV
jgi:hypothetical protein